MNKLRMYEIIMEKVQDSAMKGKEKKAEKSMKEKRSSSERNGKRKLLLTDCLLTNRNCSKLC